MRRFIEVISITALIICVVSAVFNQSNIWSYWRYIPTSIWEFSLFVGASYCYSKWVNRSWYGQLVLCTMIGFTLFNFVHAIIGLLMWAHGKWFGIYRPIQKCLIYSLEEYNLAVMLFTSGVAITCGLIYLINLPYILHKK